MKVYIAGPMSGYKGFNFDAFHAAEKYLRSAGYSPFNPAKRDIGVYGKEIAENPNGDQAVASENVGFNLREALKADMSWLCDHAEAIYMLQGWEKSMGARAEHALAVALGLKTIYQEAY